MRHTRRAHGVPRALVRAVHDKGHSTLSELHPGPRDGAAPAPTGPWRPFQLLGSGRWWVAATAALAFATLGFGIGLVAMAAYLISRAATIERTATLALAITGVRFFAIGRAALRYAERYVGHLGTFRVLTRLRVWFFRGIEPLAPGGLHDTRRGETLAGITGDIDTVQDYSLRVFVPMVAAVLTTGLVAVLYGSFSPVLAVVAVAYMALVGFVLPWVTRRVASPAAARSASAAVGIEADVVEAIGGLDELVAWGREDRLTVDLGHLSARRIEADATLAVLRATATGLGALLVGLCAMSLLALVIPLVGRGEVDPVFIAVMPLVALAAFEAVQPLAGAMEHLERARAGAGRLDALVHADPLVREPEHPVPPPTATSTTGIGLSVGDLWFGYPGDPTDALRGSSMPDAASAPGATGVFRGANLDIAAGSVTCILGPSGAGKSTLVSLLLRFVEYDQGSIRLGGTEIRDMAGSDVRSLLATVTQHDRLFDTSVRDNLLLADSEADDHRIRSALDAVGADFVWDLEGGLDGRIGENGSRLSGGQRQRLMIARALLADAPLLVLDEATAHLDPDSEARVLRGVREWTVGHTVMLISHRSAVASVADSVLELRGGHFDPM
ncbi:MAG: thiol reductant ABC exporter subunit CydC [Microthrixaceae bacterium]